MRLLPVVVIVAVGCGGGGARGDATVAVPFPSGFTPGPALGAPPPSDPSVRGHAYLEAVYDGLGAPWTQFLEDCRLRLAPAHPLNNAGLEAIAEVTIDRSGALIDLGVVGSGSEDFDVAVAGVIRDRAPYPPPPPALVSDDGRLHVRWRFARDVRQAGVAGAAIAVIQWGVERAVPKLLGEGKVGEAARRLARAPPGAARTELAESVLGAAVAQAIAGDDLEARRLAVEIATRTAIAEAGAPLRTLARTAIDPTVRAGTLAALAELGDPETAELARRALDDGPAAGTQVIAAAAAALDRVASGDLARPIIAGWLRAAAAGDAAARTASLGALAAVPAGELLGAVTALAAAGDARGRAEACPVYGRAAAQATAAWAGLIAGLRDADASVRAACAAAAGAAGAAGLTDRRTVNVVAARLVDRDHAVRAAAVSALARLDAARATGELRALGKESSPLVLAALADAWSRLSRPPIDRLRQLAGHAEPDVRAAAVTALVRLGDPASIEEAARHADDDVDAVRLAALPAVRTESGLAALTRDPALAVSAAADEALVALRGRAATLDERLALVATTDPGSPARVRAAGSWLLAR